jgi:aryl-alcohol dehydrogenase-like predicted oxidoreductase
MQQRPLGSTGLGVSALGFGCGAVGGLMVKGEPAEQRQAVTRALDAGITYFDTAALYGNGASEEHLGRVMRELGTWSRVVVGTKVRLPAVELSEIRKAVRDSLEMSLKRLARSDVDVFHLHNPIGLSGSERGQLELSVVLDEVAHALQDMKAAGLAKHVGFTGLGETTALHEVAMSGSYETMQTYFNVLNPSAGYAGQTRGEQDFEGLIDTAARAGVGVIVIRVLAAGAAAGQSERTGNAGDPGGGMAGGTYTSDLTHAERVAQLSADLGLEGPVELALRFGLAKPGISTVLVGYSTLDHLEQAIRFAERGPLPEDGVRRVLELSSE